PRALARTLRELRFARVTSVDLATLPLGGHDLSVLLDRFEREFALASATDRTTLFACATRVVLTGNRANAIVGLPLVFLDVPFDSQAEFDFGKALRAAAANAIVTVPFGELQTLDRLETVGYRPEVLEQRGDTDPVALRRHLFASSRPPERTPK